MKQHAYGQCAAVMTSLASLLYYSISKRSRDSSSKSNVDINYHNNNSNKTASGDMIMPSNAFDSIISSGSAITVSKLCAMALHAAECITDAVREHGSTFIKRQKDEMKNKLSLYSFFTRSSIPFLRLRLYIAHCESKVARCKRHTRSYNTLWSNNNVLMYNTNVNENENVKMINSYHHLVHELIVARLYTDAFRLTRL